MQHIRNLSLYFAWVIALIASLGSLYYSEIKGWQPCPLCWYQRICLFPMVWLLAVAAYKQDKSQILYVLPLLGIGFLLAFLQVLGGYFPDIFSTPLCGLHKSCSHTPSFLGFLSFPWISLGTFLVISLLVIHSKKAKG
jgi:disulfide bond formation protein DsbB